MDYHNKTLSIQNLLYPSFSSNPDGISGDLFFKGCHRHCKGCHNAELQEFGPPNTSIYDVVEAIRDNNINIITLMGGEPLDQDIEALIQLIIYLHHEFPSLKIGLYTGYEFQDIPRKLLLLLDYVKTGYYDENNLSNGDYMLASYNQHFYKKSGSDFVNYENKAVF